MRIYFKILILAFVLLVQTVHAQVQVNKETAVQEQKIAENDSAKLADKIASDNMNMIISDKLDSLVSTWYIKNSFTYDKTEFDALPEELKSYLPDSVYKSRLQHIDSFLPLPYNETVRNYIGLYTIRKRDLTSFMLGLSNYYFPIFEEALERYQLPHELKYLPIIESALNPTIRSRAGAGGLWQFMVGTAKLYGLEVNSYIDERNDPIKASDAAARYLRDLYAIYGDWHVVIAAYNCGPGNINKAVRRSGGKQGYWDIYYSLPRETRGYIPVFIAANYMVNYFKEHKIVYAEPKFKTVTDTIEVHNYVNFEQLSAVMNISVEELRQLNPQYRRDVIPARPDKPYLLKLPVDAVSAFIDNQTQIFAYNRDKYFPNNELVPLKARGKGSKVTRSSSTTSPDGMTEITHVVEAGDNLGAIAAQYHVTVNDLKEWNDFRKKTLQIGQQITVYVAGKSKNNAKQKPASAPQTVAMNSSANVSVNPAASIPVVANPAAATASQTNQEYTIYTVQDGDSLFTIAKKFPGITDAELIAVNKIRNVRGLYPGQQLKIPKRA